jgi:arylamine N-acetyltransferase
MDAALSERVISNLLDQVDELKTSGNIGSSGSSSSSSSGSSSGSSVAEAALINVATTLIQKAYLRRLGLSPCEIQTVTRNPSEASLSMLYYKHITRIPFENLGQHLHPAGKSGQAPAVAVLQPTLNIDETLQKIVFNRRGGFCWEINFAFAWLLRTLGYCVRLGNCFVLTPDGAQPGHLVLFVDGLGNRGTLLVDPGFGDPPRSLVPIGTKDGSVAPVMDCCIGDSYRLERTSKYGPRFNLKLMRQRAAASGSGFIDVEGRPTPLPEPTPFESVYIINDNDDLGFDSEEFVHGLVHVLREEASNIFHAKRFATMPTQDGHIVQGANYVKFVVHGVQVGSIEHRRVA